MRLAIAYEPATGNVCQHFGETPAFWVADIEDGKIVNEMIYPNGGATHMAVACNVVALQADALIVGDIGSGAFNYIFAAGIKIYGPCRGSAMVAKTDFMENRALPCFGPTHQCSCHCGH